MQFDQGLHWLSLQWITGFVLALLLLLFVRECDCFLAIKFVVDDSSSLVSFFVSFSGQCVDVVVVDNNDDLNRYI